MQKPAANRVVAFIGGVLLLVMALTPVIADMDWKSTAGVLAGIPALAIVIYKWLEGWQRWESPDSFSPTVVAVPTPPASVALTTELVPPPAGAQSNPRREGEPALDPELDGESFALDDLDPAHEERDLHEADHALADGGDEL